MKNLARIHQKRTRQKSRGTYAEDSGGFLTSLRKRWAFAAASSRLVAATAPLSLFSRPPRELGPARRFLGPSCLGWWATSPSSSTGLLAKVAEGFGSPSSPSPPPSASASNAAAPKSGSLTSLSARSEANWRGGPVTPDAGWIRGFWPK